uniref:Selenoprotein P N-terminal domain-containing protein n=1 Tax=Panagrolaimus sp. JU765 TaxID=591449 RepID=A0AC34QDY5_9BILA
MFWPKLLFLLVLFLWSFDGIRSIPAFCSVAQRWSINGRPFVDEYRGRVLMLVFTRLDCAKCEEKIKKCDAFLKYETLAEQWNTEVNVVAVVPRSESDVRVSALQKQLRTIRIAKESVQEPLWGWLNVGHNDGLIFDRCGRLAKRLQFSENPETMKKIFESLKTVVIGQPCGICAYDEPSLKRIQSFVKPTPQVLPPMLTAYVSPNRQNSPPIHQTNHRQSSQTNSVASQSPANSNHGKKEFETLTVDYRRNSSGNRILAQQQQPGVFNNEWAQVPAKSAFNKFPAETKPLKNNLSAKNSLKPATLQTTPEAFYSDAEDAKADSDYYDYVADFTTSKPEYVQIPKPSSPSLFWPTKIPGGLSGHGHSQTCTGYNDEICYQQFLQLDESEIHRCCKKKIVLTDQCVPGKCSNSTQQLCCIQKLLQAKFSCCSDEDQGLATSPTDQFSRCCYSNFVTSDDSCCPFSYASSQWRAVHELCLPNVQIDLSNVKVKTVVAGTYVTVDFDFRQTKRWKFDCKYGGQIDQYSFIPGDSK